MRGLLGADGWVAALSTALLLARHAKPQPVRPAGLAPQAFHPCPRCRSEQPHLLHSSTCRRCLTCNHLTHPGDPK